MELVIKLVTIYWTHWQRTAIANPLYSVVLAVLALLMGGLIVYLFKRGKIAKLIKQVTQGKQQLEKAEKTREDLLTTQKNDGEKMTDLQHQLEQAAKNLQNERNEHQSEFSKKDELFLKSANKKHQEMAAINTMLDEKTLLVDRLQSDLNSQESKIAQYEKAQAKIVEMEKQVKLTESELNTVKQQLETELINKNEQIEQSEKINKDRVSELELQLKKITETDEAEKQHQEEIRKEEPKEKELIKQQSEKNQILQENIESEAITDPVENKVPPIHKTVSHSSIASDKSQVQVKDEEPLKQEGALAKEPNTEKQGVVGQVLGWFSSMDKALENNEVTQNDLKPEQNRDIEREPMINENPNSEASISDDEESSFSEKMAEVADKMDSFPGQFKKLYRKVKK